MWEIVSWIIILAVVAAAVAAGAVLIKAYMTGESPTAVFFKPRVDPRLGVVEFANVDSKRKLILIRRDDVEHLIMIGGPVDMVVETGIAVEPVRRNVESFRETATFKDATAPAVGSPVFSRAPRHFGPSAHGQVPPAITPTTVDEVEAALKL